MRLTRFAVLAALFGSVGSAQVPARQAATGELETDLHYAPGTDTWISTNKQAYVALFDVSRTGVTQIYPVFSAQAASPVGNEHRLVSIGQGGIGFPSGSALFSGSRIFRSASYVNNTWASGIGGWPHTLLLVASTSPLRVESPYATNLRLNLEVIRRRLLNLQSESGIETLIDLVRPADPDAEVAYDRVDGIQARTAQYASSDYFSEPLPVGPWLQGCAIVDRSQLLTFPGMPFTPICALPYPTPPAKPATPPKDTGTTITPTNTPANMYRNVYREAGAARKLTDPEDIRRFLEAQTGRRTDANAVSVSGGASVGRQGAQGADRSTPEVNRRGAEPAAVRPTDQRPTNGERVSIKPQDQPRPAPTPAREAAPMSPPPVMSSPAPAPSPPPVAPIKPQD